MEDIAFKIPIPEGTKYVEGGAPATTSAGFTGQEVIFFTSVFHLPIQGAFFIVEITDPEQTVFTTDVLIEWKGDRPGSYLLEDVTLDITKEDLDWGNPRYRLDLGLMATVNEDDTITYSVYPAKGSWLRMWDLRINIPVPEGTRFLSMTAPPQYGTDYDGKVVYFKIAELPQDADFGPPRFVVSTEDVPDNQPVVTHAWAAWKNSARSVGWRFPLEEQLTTGDLIVQPRLPQQALADIIDDVPLSNYDVTAIALQDDGPNLKVTFHMVEPPTTNEPLVFMFFVDQDCRDDTGQWRIGRGTEYRARYRPQQKEAEFTVWDEEQQNWLHRESLPLEYDIDNKTVILELPYSLIDYQEKFCWVSIVRNNSQEFTTYLPSDRTPDSYISELTEYRPTNTAELATTIDEALASKEIVTIPIRVAGQSADEETAPIEPPDDEAPTDSEDAPTSTGQPQTDRPANQSANPKPTPTRQPATPTVTPTITNDDFILLGDEWQYQPGWSAPPANWADQGFDDSDWFTGKTTLGYGDGTFETDLSLSLSYLQQRNAATAEQPSDDSAAVSPPRTDFTTLYMRHNFPLEAPDDITKLTLTIDYEDGFVAYLNGVEVARRNLKAPGTPLSHDTPATDRDAGTPEIIDLSQFIKELIEGDNLLALEVHRAIGPSNLQVSPELTWERQTSPPPVQPPPTPTQPAATPTTASAPTATPQPQSVAPTATIASNELAQAQPVSPTPASIDPGIVPPAPTPIIPTVDDNSPTIPAVHFSPPDPNPSIIDAHGKIAIPVDNGYGLYDVHVYTLRFGYGWETSTVPQARQPHISTDGQRMLINQEGNDVVDNIFEYNFITGIKARVSDNPLDAHPFYDYWGNRVVYDNPKLVIGPDGVAYSHIMVQCTLLPPHQESDPRCRDITSLGVLVPAGHTGRIEGGHPVWASNDQIIYNGCDSWVGGSSCGIYSVGSWATKGFSDGIIPTQLTYEPSDIPTDTHGHYVVFMSQRDNNWEAFIMSLDGKGMRNLSQSAASNDGLPTISPDGNWVAFVSDRDGHWAVWAVPLVGGQAYKLFDFPVATPWASHERSWVNERISWGW